MSAFKLRLPPYPPPPPALILCSSPLLILSSLPLHPLLWVTLLLTTPLLAAHSVAAARGLPTDVNECWVSPGRLCQHTCENTPGSYRCSCAAGFLLAADGKHCEGTARPDF